MSWIIEKPSAAGEPRKWVTVAKNSMGDHERVLTRSRRNAIRFSDRESAEMVIHMIDTRNSEYLFATIYHEEVKK